jgi:glycosyltransferase involved in cell wall biosynthesis
VDSPRFSILIPARDEEKYLPGCLESIKTAAEPFPDQVEIIVALNRCTDRTEAIALEYRAKVVRDEQKNLAKIR